MDGVMIQLRLPDGEPTLGEAAAILGLALGDLDPEFGVIPIDPADALYAVRVRSDSADRAARAIAKRGADEAEGIFSDPRIAPFGPPED